MNSVKRLAGPAFYVNCDFDEFTLTANKRENNPSSIKGYGIKSEDVLFDVKEGEVLVTHVNKSRGRRMFKACGRGRVLSSLNGALTETADESSLLEDYNFIGVAQTEHKYVRNPRDKQGLVACVGGVFTITNLSDSTISPGEMLYMNTMGTKYRKIRRRGIPEHKMVFCLSSTDPSVVGTVLYRPVAKALSYSKPGQRLDILLHPRYPISGP